MVEPPGSVVRAKAFDIKVNWLDDFNIRYDDNLIRISIAVSLRASLAKGKYFVE